jgi:hypothetical protein
MDHGVEELPYPLALPPFHNRLLPRARSRDEDASYGPTRGVLVAALELSWQAGQSWWCEDSSHGARAPPLVIQPQQRPPSDAQRGVRPRCRGTADTPPRVSRSSPRQARTSAGDRRAS